MISYFGSVVLVATAGFGSKNISTTTSADAEISLKVVLTELLDGTIDHEASIFRLNKLDSCSGSKTEFNLMLGKECTLEGFLPQIQVAVNTVPFPAICEIVSVSVKRLVQGGKLTVMH
jgi:hypothetical protein